MIYIVRTRGVLRPRQSAQAVKEVTKGMAPMQNRTDVGWSREIVESPLRALPRTQEAQNVTLKATTGNVPEPLSKNFEIVGQSHETKVNQQHTYLHVPHSGPHPSQCLALTALLYTTS